MGVTSALAAMVTGTVSWQTRVLVSVTTWMSTEPSMGAGVELARSRVTVGLDPGA